MIAAQPVAITLRYLQTLTEIAAEKNSTIIFPLPIEMLHLLRQVLGVEPKSPNAPSQALTVLAELVQLGRFALC